MERNERNTFPTFPMALLERIIFSDLNPAAKVVHLASHCLMNRLDRVADAQVAAQLDMSLRSVKRCMAELKAKGFVQEAE